MTGVQTCALPIFYEFEIDGVVTNADFQLDLISDRSVIAGDYDTSFLMETFLPEYQNREG